MTEHKDMTISEIEEVLKEYTCEFVMGRDNLYVTAYPDTFMFPYKTKYDFTKMVYFESREKVEKFIEKISIKNFNKYFIYLYKDFTISDKCFDNEYTLQCIETSEKLFSYSTSYKNKNSFYIIRALKENNKYVIKYIKCEEIEMDNEYEVYFSTLEEAKKAVNEIGEYNVLHYYLYIKDSVLNDTTYIDLTTNEIKDEILEKDAKVFEDTTQQNDMVKKPSHYQGKYGLEVYEVLENFLEDVKSFYLGNVIKYILRYRKKNKLEDLKKAREYIDKLIEEYENGN